MATVSVRAAALLLLALLPQLSVQAFTNPSQVHQRSLLSNRFNENAFVPANCRQLTKHAQRTNINQRFMSTQSSPYESPQIDTPALLKYTIASAVELSLFTGTFASLDFLTTALNISPSNLPLPLLSFMFYAISLKSRVFNPLNNSRPDRAKARQGQSSVGFKDRIMPSWTPPGVVFPIMWLLIIGPIRAYSSALVVTTTNSFLSLPLMAFIAHLTIGDVWNTINNTEKRMGAAVIGVLFVWMSAVNASFRYFAVLPLAGKLLGLTCVWLTIAAALVTDTWRLNTVDINCVEGRVPLYPVKGEAETGFVWFSSGGGNEELGEDTASVSAGPGCIRKVDGVDEEKVTYRNRDHIHKALQLSE